MGFKLDFGSSALVDLTSGVTGVLPAANGGTGSATGTWAISGAWAVTASTTVALTATGGTLTLATGANNNIILSPGGTGLTTTAGKVTITNATNSGSVSTGALIISGGIGSAGVSYFQNIQNLGGFTLGSGGTTAVLYCPSAGNIQLTTGGFNDFGRLMFGLTTSAAPALKRSSAELQCRLGDDSGDAVFKASYYKSASFTVATLPAAATAAAGAKAYVTDALTPTFGSAVTGGGAVGVPVYSTGSAWNVG